MAVLIVLFAPVSVSSLSFAKDIPHSPVSPKVALAQVNAVTTHADSASEVSPHNVLPIRVTSVPVVQKGLIPIVPFYSQFADISSPKWKKVGCGIASLAMVIDFYEPNVESVDSLLKRGILAGAFRNDVGWSHNGLIALTRKYGLDGKSNDYSRLGSRGALSELKKSLKDGPVIASIHYKFEPSNPIPHLVVINAVQGDVVYYNDPADTSGNKQISTSKFLKAWKMRFITVRPLHGGSTTV